MENYPQSEINNSCYFVKWIAFWVLLSFNCCWFWLYWPDLLILLPFSRGARAIFIHNPRFFSLPFYIDIRIKIIVEFDRIIAFVFRFCGLFTNLFLVGFYWLLDDWVNKITWNGFFPFEESISPEILRTKRRTL